MLNPTRLPHFQITGKVRLMSFIKSQYGHFDRVFKGKVDLYNNEVDYIRLLKVSA